MQTDAWLPLTEYALRSGISISTLRRKIKSNLIAFKMEDGRYLIRCDEMDAHLPDEAFASSDQVARPVDDSALREFEERERQIREQLQKMADENALRWRAMDARVAGLARKVEMLCDQMGEVKMLVKLFEEKLDSRG